jgi:hypothetical protein
VLAWAGVNLLLIVVCAAFVSGLRSKDRELPVRVIPLVLMCMAVAVAYLSQRVI